jgi:DNA-binding NarL/FixJ family response regulator
VRLAEEELALARTFGTARTIAAALRAAGLLEPGERGLELLEQAVAALDGSPAPVEHARALVDLGAALRRSGRRAAARGPLARGRELALRCGALALTDEAGTELRAAGARPRRLTLTGVDALTTSQRRVAEMAARGLRNPEIAQALFISRKTVEMHLSNAYRTLDISSREQLSHALAG